MPRFIEFVSGNQSLTILYFRIPFVRFLDIYLSVDNIGNVVSTDDNVWAFSSAS